jgi:membrane protein YqaA with SNARE-associated domain
MRTNQKHNEPRTASDWFHALSPLALALLLSLAIVLLVAVLRKQVKELEGYGYLSAFVVGLVGNATVVLPAPSLAFTVALGGVLNPLLVGLAAGAGEALGEMTGYLAGISGKRIVRDQERYLEVQRQMDRYGGWVFFILAAIPNPLFDIAGIAAGTLRFPVWKFLLSAAAGKTLKAMLFAGAGRQFL